MRRSQRARKPPDRLEMNVTVIQVFVFLNCAKVPVYVQRYASYNTIVMFSEFVECWNLKGEKCCNVNLLHKISAFLFGLI